MLNNLSVTVVDPCSMLFANENELLPHKKQGLGHPKGRERLRVRGGGGDL